MTKLVCVGDKLRCTNVNGWEDDFGDNAVGPECSEVVTVRWVGIESLGGNRYRCEVWLDEYPGDTPEDSFWLECFEFID